MYETFRVECEELESEPTPSPSAWDAHLDDLAAVASCRHGGATWPR
jgi:hypothetical protein